MNWIVAAMAFMPMFWPPVALFFNLDPCFVAIKDLKYSLRISNNNNTRISTYALRYLTTLWFSIEQSRSFTIYALGFVSVFNIYVSCTHIISRQPPSHSTINLYNELNCVSQKGAETLRKYGGLTMWAGFVTGVLGLWGIVMGPKLLPVSFFILVCWVTFVILGITQQSLKRVVECN